MKEKAKKKTEREALTAVSGDRNLISENACVYVSDITRAFEKSARWHV